MLRVPEADLDRALALVTGPGGVGKELDRTTSAQDVTGDLADLASRVATQQASVARVRALLASATSLKDIVLLESEVSTRESDLEALQARRAVLADQADLATLTVDLRTPATIPPPPAEPADPNAFLQGLQSGWHAVVASTTVIVTVLGALLPLAVVAALLGVPVLWVLRRRRSAAGPQAPAPARPPPPLRQTRSDPQAAGTSARSHGIAPAGHRACVTRVPGTSTVSTTRSSSGRATRHRAGRQRRVDAPRAPGPGRAAGRAPRRARAGRRAPPPGHLAQLDLRTLELGRREQDQRPVLLVDVDEHRALPGRRVPRLARRWRMEVRVGVPRPAHAAELKPSCGVPRYGNVSGEGAGRSRPDEGGRAVGRVRGRDQGIRHAGDRPQLDGDDVVAHPSPVGEAGEVATQDAQRARLGAVGGTARFSRSTSAYVAPV